MKTSVEAKVLERVAGLRSSAAACCARGWRLAEYVHANFPRQLSDFADFPGEVAPQNEIVESIEVTPTLDREQLREVTMDDEDLMREVLSVLWDERLSRSRNSKRR